MDFDMAIFENLPQTPMQKRLAMLNAVLSSNPIQTLADGDYLITDQIAGAVHVYIKICSIWYTLANCSIAKAKTPSLKQCGLVKKNNTIYLYEV